MYFLFVEIIEPINCILISEEVPSISIVLSERRPNALKGKFFTKSNFKGDFFTHKPTKEKPTTWSFENSNLKSRGEAILFKNRIIWHSYQNEIKSYQVNRVLFSGLASNLSKITNDINLLKATSGFFEIGSECYGGKINKA